MSAANPSGNKPNKRNREQYKQRQLEKSEAPQKLEALYNPDTGKMEYYPSWMVQKAKISIAMEKSTWQAVENVALAFRRLGEAMARASDPMQKHIDKLGKRK